MNKICIRISTVVLVVLQLVTVIYSQPVDFNPPFQVANASASMRTWWHRNSEFNDKTMVGDLNVRRSGHYFFHVSESSDATDYKNIFDSYGYMTIPRGGKKKWLYSSPDGAELVSQFALSMTWTQFEYSKDVYLYVTVPDPTKFPSTLSTDVTIRPTTLKLDLEPVDGKTFRVKIPYRPEGMKFSIELEKDLVDITSGGEMVHRQPQNGLLVFAQPMESHDSNPSTVPDVNGDGVYFPKEGPLSNLDGLDGYHTIYFKPGVYSMAWNYHANLSSDVNWVYFAPGSFVKGSFQFQDTQKTYTVSGNGVLSMEKYVYEADRNNTYKHTVAEECWSTCLYALQFQSRSGTTQTLRIHGITVMEPSYHSMEAYGDTSTLLMDVDQYKQIGGWYWQTDGLEIFDGGKEKNSFYHANDDVLKMYNSNVRRENILVWKVENGPVVQFGWWVRNMSNAVLNNVDIIHNIQTNYFNNTGVIGSAYDMNATSNCQLSGLVSDVTFSNIRSEGKNICAFSLYVCSSWKNINIQNLYVEDWNGMGKDSVFTKSCGNATLTPGSLNIKDYVVKDQKITFANNNWNSNELGKLNFDGSLWGNWTLV
eukprot:Nk52_evm14s152 gene=Nk52_evmTU14s152